MQLGKWEDASNILDKAIKNSVPHQPVYWQSRRIKGECLVHLGQYDKAHFELNLCVKRQFIESDPNFAWRKSAMFYMSRVLAEQKKDKEAMEMFLKALDTQDALEPVLEKDQTIFYNAMLQKSGRKPKVLVEKDSTAKPALA
jgi:tetratricopeptide (TPR) repeat protein